MNKTVTKEKTFENSAAYSLMEATLDEQVTALDESGWIIKAPKKPQRDHARIISIKDRKNVTIAAAIVEPAQTSVFQQATRLDATALDKSIFLNSVWVAPHANNAQVIPAILYFALRCGRMMGRQNIAALLPVPNKEMPISTLLQLDPLEKVPQITIEKQHYLPVAQQLKYAIHLAYQRTEGELRELINNHFIDEILTIHKTWIESFYHGSWAQAVVNGTLTKEQYISSLCNLHQYVRQTTRLAARCVAHAEDIDLRNHFIYHLKGEINHELLIERDLKYLGADVEYVKTSHVPDPGTKEFMVVQESTIGFYQDPVMMMACPLAAEGFAAYLQSSFLEALYQTIGSWGVKKPKEAARFLSSHVQTDGGDDGHFIHVVNMIKKFITDENKQQTFLSVLIAAMNGFEHGFNANIDDLKLWEAAPKEMNQQ